jgi:hypothetical protein
MSVVFTRVSAEKERPKINTPADPKDLEQLSNEDALNVT